MIASAKYRLREIGPFVGVFAVLSLLCSCKGDNGRIRVYREVQIRSERPLPAGHGNHEAPTSRPSGDQATGSLHWTTPDGWQETPGSGMRLATFSMGSAEEVGQCTIVTLSGRAGGLNANVERWFGQLGLPVPGAEDFNAFLDGQEQLKTESGMSLVLVDFTGLTEVQTDRSDSMLVGVLSDAQKSIFVKLTGPISLLNGEKERLALLCRSMRFEP